MKMRYGLLAIGCLSLFLSSCADNQVESAPSSSRYQWSSTIRSLPSSSSSAESSGKESIAFGSSSESSAKLESSSSTTVYYTVSIYQSYYIEKEGRYGNPRFDTSVIYEAGQILFSSVDEKNALADRLRPVFHPTGGTYVVDYFYPDTECSKRIPYGLVIEDDLSIYYRCYD